MELHAEKHQEFMARKSQSVSLVCHCSHLSLARLGNVELSHRFWEAAQQKGYTKASKKLQPESISLGRRVAE